MRLTAKEVAAIKASAQEAFGPNVVVRVFGSRLDDQRRGGDIDLHLQVPEQSAPGASARFRRLLNQRVGEREYDILVATAGQHLSPVHQNAVTQGVVL